MEQWEKYAASGADALLAMGPLVLRQMHDQMDTPEAAGNDESRLIAYVALRQIVSWLQAAMRE